MWMEIWTALTTNEGNDAEKIYARELDRLNISLTSKRMKAVCEAMPSIWRSVVLQHPRLGVKFPFTTTVEYLKKHILLSRSKPLLIAFQLPFSRDAGDKNVDLLIEVMKVVDRIEEIYLVGDGECSANTRCLHSVLLEHGRLHSAAQLRVLQVKTLYGLPTICHRQHPFVWIDPEPLRSLLFGPPSRLIVRFGVDLTINYQHLTYMDILNDLSQQWLTIFDRCSRLRSLVWRSTAHTVTAWPKKKTVTSLLNFTIYDITILPPIIAPHLEWLIVHDTRHPFALSTLNVIVGHHQSSLEELDLLANPILNSEVIAVFARCSNLTTFRVSCVEVRTMLYEAVRDRVYYEYWRDTKFKLHRVEFAKLPPNQSRYAAARDRYAEMVALGVCDHSGIHFHTKANQLMIRSFCLPFQCWPTSPDSKQLAGISGLTHSLLAIVNLEKETGQQYHSTFTMILVTWDNTAADELIRKGVTFKGSQYPVERCPDKHVQ
ncbi:hypothetical protein DFH09DRAFT_1079123 [Mycena vulgaris]|nr:hypothetical protein DFH09DRAFT_1079123 [Mycena vulgaris]